MRSLLPSFAIAFALLAGAPAGAQAAPTAPTLREIARAEALGGRVTALSLRPDGRRLLTAGAHGDLLLWELPAGKVLLRPPTIGAAIDEVALHPTQPLALYSLRYGNGLGAVFAIDIDSGRTRFLAPSIASGLVFSRDGTLCALRCRTSTTQRIVTLRCEGLVGDGPLPEVASTPWQVAQAGVLQFVDRPGGPQIEVVPQASKATRESDVPHPRLGELPAHRDLAEVTDTTLDLEALADDGTFVAADDQGQLLVQGREPQARRTLLGHRGEAHRLVWTPDGRFLALVSPGAVRVVDTNGHVVADLPGGCYVQAGPQGSEFWLLGRFELRRWNAAEARDVGRAREWSEPRARLVARRSRWTGTEHAEFVPAMVLDGEPWFCTSRRNELCHLGAAGEETVRGLSGLTTFYAMVPLPSGEAVVQCGVEAKRSDLNRAVLGPDTIGAPYRLVHVAHGQVAASIECRNVYGVFADAGDRSTILVYLHEFEGELPHHLDRRRVDDLSIVTKHGCSERFLHIAPFDDHHLLAATASSLHVLDAASLTNTGQLQLPADLPGITTFAIAPDHLHLAIANGPDVRILAVETR